MTNPFVTSILNTPTAKTPKETASSETKKPEKEFSKILDEKTKEESSQPKNDKLKEEIQARLSGEIERHWTPIQRFLYELIYRDKSTWSLADRQQFHVEKEETASTEFSKLLSERGLKLSDLSKTQLAQISQLPTKQELGSFLDAAREALVAQAQPANRQKQVFSEIKTSLQELTNGNRVKENQIVESLIHQMTIRKLNEGSEVRLTLNPEALGQVRLQLVMNKNELTAHFETENANVTQMLNEHLDELSEALQKQGLKVKTLDVATDWTPIS